VHAVACRFWLDQASVLAGSGSEWCRESTPENTRGIDSANYYAAHCDTDIETRSIFSCFSTLLAVRFPSACTDVLLFGQQEMFMRLLHSSTAANASTMLKSGLTLGETLCLLQEPDTNPHRQGMTASLKSAEPNDVVDGTDVLVTRVQVLKLRPVGGT
jgi:hypothetical protein